MLFLHYIEFVLAIHNVFGKHHNLNRMPLWYFLFIWFIGPFHFSGVAVAAAAAAIA